VMVNGTVDAVCNGQELQVVYVETWGEGVVREEEVHIVLMHAWLHAASLPLPLPLPLRTLVLGTCSSDLYHPLLTNPLLVRV
jgi:hypothetical protein